jgi:hypothetical protein
MGKEADLLSLSGDETMLNLAHTELRLMGIQTSNADLLFLVITTQFKLFRFHPVIMSYAKLCIT